MTTFHFILLYQHFICTYPEVSRIPTFATWRKKNRPGGDPTGKRADDPFALRLPSTGYRGIFDYRDEGFFRSCNEGSLEKLLGERERMQKVVDFVTQ